MVKKNSVEPVLIKWGRVVNRTWLPFSPLVFVASTGFGVATAFLFFTDLFAHSRYDMASVRRKRILRMFPPGVGML